MTKKSPGTTTAASPSRIVVLRTDQGEQLLLGPRLFGGGEGTIHGVAGNDTKVVKLYHAQNRTPDREAKLKAMLTHPPRDDTQRAFGHPSLTWPERVLYADGRFVGYGMTYITNAWPLVEAYNPTLRARKGRPFNWRILYHAAANLAKAVNALHVHGYIVGDLNQNNLLVNKDALITLVDTDSFQVRDGRDGRIFYPKVGMPDFTPPELYGKQLATTARSWYHDAFGLAVMIFMILMEGNHPFTGYPRSGIATGALIFQDNIQKGIFPYDPASGYAPPPGAPPFSMLPPGLQALFRQAFVTAHIAPGARPSPLVWIDELDNNRALLVECRRDRRHVYSSHQTDCPWCARATQHATTSARSSSKQQSASQSSATTTPTTQPAAQPAQQPTQQQTPPSDSSIAGVILWILLLLALGAFAWWALAANGLLP